MKVVIAPMIWKRPQVFEVFAEGIKILKGRFDNVEFIIHCVGSEGEESKQRAKAHGFNYTEAPNYPLSEKAQIRLEEVRKYKPDYWLSLSDDDFITPSYFAYILNLMFEGYEYIAPYDIYYYRNGSIYYSYGYPQHHRRNGEPLAIGRCVSFELMDRIDWNLWGENTIDRGLDRDAYTILNDNAKSKHFFNCRDIGGMVVDVKSNVNKSAWTSRHERHKVTDHADLLFDYRLTKKLNNVPHAR